MERFLILFSFAPLQLLASFIHTFLFKIIATLVLIAQETDNGLIGIVPIIKHNDPSYCRQCLHHKWFIFNSLFSPINKPHILPFTHDPQDVAELLHLTPREIDATNPSAWQVLAGGNLKPVKEETPKQAVKRQVKGKGKAKTPPGIEDSNEDDEDDAPPLKKACLSPEHNSASIEGQQPGCEGQQVAGAADKGQRAAETAAAASAAALRAKIVESAEHKAARMAWQQEEEQRRVARVVWERRTSTRGSPPSALLPRPPRTPHLFAL